MFSKLSDRSFCYKITNLCLSSVHNSNMDYKDSKYIYECVYFA